MDAQQLKEFKKDKTKAQVKVIDYFTKSGCLSSIMSDDQYWQMVKDRRDSLQLKKRALEKIGLDEDQVKEIPPASFEGYWFFDNPWAKRTKGEKGPWVSSAYQVSWVFFSDTQIYLFSHTFHMDEDKKAERTDEFFYKDVTSFSTSTENYNTKSAGAAEVKVEAQIFALVVPGDKLSIAMSGTKGADQIIQAMKQKLREKKTN